MMTRRLTQDIQVGWVIIVTENDKESGNKHQVEALPVSGFAWTINDQPSDWRSLIK